MSKAASHDVPKDFVEHGFAPCKLILTAAVMQANVCFRHASQSSAAHPERVLISFFELWGSGSDFPGHPPEAQEKLGGDHQ